MSVDVFLLINLLALFHRNTALPARLPSSGGAPRTSCVIPEPRLPKLHSCFPTDHSDVSPGVHPHRDLPSCHQPNGYRPRLDKMVSAKAPHWRGAQAQAQWLLKRGCRLLLLLMVLITPSDVSPGVHPHRDQPSCHKPRLDKMVSASGHQLRGTHDQWLVKRLNPVPVVIGDDFDGLFGGSALLGLKSLPHPLSWVWGRSVFGFL